MSTYGLERHDRVVAIRTRTEQTPQVAGEVYETRSRRYEVRVNCPYCREIHWHDVTEHGPDVLLRCPLLGCGYRVPQPTYGARPGSDYRQSQCCGRGIA